MNRYSIESAYAFLHQKWRVYKYSTLHWQQDDIECIIADYTAQMDAELYAALAKGRNDYLRDHTRFAADMEDAVNQLEAMLNL